MSAYREASVGFFVLLGLLCIAYMTIKLGRMEVMSSDGYMLKARFNSVAGLRTGADVEIAGVMVGKVAGITLDPAKAQAVVSLSLKKDLSLGEDSIASVKTSGLIGDKYISISPGGSNSIIPHGGEITETESAVDLESIIGKFAFGGV